MYCCMNKKNVKNKIGCMFDNPIAMLRLLLLFSLVVIPFFIKHNNSFPGAFYSGPFIHTLNSFSRNGIGK